LAQGRTMRMRTAGGAFAMYFTTNDVQRMEISGSANSVGIGMAPDTAFSLRCASDIWTGIVRTHRMAATAVVAPPAMNAVAFVGGSYSAGTHHGIRLRAGGSPTGAAFLTFSGPGNFTQYNDSAGGLHRLLWRYSGAAEYSIDRGPDLDTYTTIANLNQNGRFSCTSHWVLDGTAAEPAYGFSNDIDVGLYRSGVNQLSVTTGGAQRFVVGDALVESKQNFKAPAIECTGTLDVGGALGDTIVPAFFKHTVVTGGTPVGFTSHNASVACVRIGSVVFLSFYAFTLTTLAASPVTKQITGLIPSDYRPTTDFCVGIGQVGESTGTRHGMVVIRINGDVTFFTTNSSAQRVDLPTSGNATYQALTISYIRR